MRPDSIINEARPFDPQAYFYSRTDRRGVIESGNRLFFQVSGYDPEDLVGAPHRIVRHPDMPRGAFQLIWTTLQAGNPAVAYVKNLARDGRYYWVMATILPFHDGYLSVRTGAAGPLFDQTRALYARMLRAEAAGASPADSAQMMLAELAEAGFPSFAAYGGKLLMSRLNSSGNPDSRSIRLERMCDFIGRVNEARSALIDTLRTLYLIPTNMRILASRMEPSGGPISAISDSYKRAAAELMTRLTGAGRSRSGRDELPAGNAALVEKTVLLACTAELVSEAMARIVNEPPVPGINAVQESAILRAALEDDCRKVAQDNIDRIMQSVQQIVREAENVKRLMAGLDQIRILGEVESGRLRSSDGGLAAIMSQLTSFHSLIHSRLTTMSNTAARMVGMEI